MSDFDSFEDYYGKIEVSTKESEQKSIHWLYKPSIRDLVSQEEKDKAVLYIGRNIMEWLDAQYLCHITGEEYKSKFKSESDILKDIQK